MSTYEFPTVAENPVGKGLSALRKPMGRRTFPRRATKNAPREFRGASGQRGERAGTGGALAPPSSDADQFTSRSMRDCIELAASSGDLRPSTAACDSSRKIAATSTERSNEDGMTCAIFSASDSAFV